MVLGTISHVIFYILKDFSCCGIETIYITSCATIPSTKGLSVPKKQSKNTEPYNIAKFNIVNPFVPIEINVKMHLNMAHVGIF